MKARHRMAAVVAVAAAVFAGNHVIQRRGRDGHRVPAMTGASSAANAKEVVPAAPATWKIGSLTLTACELRQPNSGLSTAAWCAAFPVPENRADPRSRVIRLKLAVLRSRAQPARPDMLVFLAGGPGQAATDSAGTVAEVLHGLRSHRNVLLLDQRGTGGSNPLQCKEPDESGDAAEGDGFDAGRVRAAASDCLRQLGQRANPRYYTTTIAAQDLEDVRRALGAPSFDLIGVSYGTRLAQQYLMHYPAAVRSMVLDSVVPNSVALGQDFARNLEDALQAQFARCTAQPACKQRFGDPEQTLYQLRDALRANPHMVSFRDPLTYRTVKRVLNENALAGVVRMFAYTPQTAALLPLSIDAAAHGDVGPLLGQAKILAGDLSELAGSGMQYSVMCSEDVDLLHPRERDADTILGTGMIDAMKAVCSVWPRGSRPADFHQPLHTAKPVLLLAGQYDPVTPPRYAEEVARGLPDARVLVLKGQAHSVMGAGCAPSLIAHFVEKLDPRTLDASCLDRLQPTPFFVDFNGATP
ncbi:MAG: alpha/beta fold hydrolase [Pseudomonadota bacterium]|jgi:pimeloyl-ACP methyl ester carboxylesterase|nr:alpha/beta fold hydrolase [Xanthomonadaceae bacterium]MDE2249470.1 alpha/beta fold hydrolase [Xanthomonadaceae bacterium]MDE3209668.1 alpha/beta fold hydrolase [Pseudomonadota bacterium]